MSRKGDCWDNAVVESFFANLKREMNGADNLQSRTLGTLQVRALVEYCNEVAPMPRSRIKSGYDNETLGQVVFGGRGIGMFGCVDCGVRWRHVGGGRHGH